MAEYEITLASSAEKEIKALPKIEKLTSNNFP